MVSLQNNPNDQDMNSSKTVLQGIVEAGFSTPTDGLSDGENLSIDEWIINDKDKSYMLRVRSDSMADAGIQIDDYLVVERTSIANTGSIVLVVVDGKWTMGYLRNNKDGYFIERANSKYTHDQRCIYPKDSLLIEAKVIAVIRKYD
jgi:SOS-response transcriptional repressor LexA